jgi:hypothetical protein
LNISRRLKGDNNLNKLQESVYAKVGNKPVIFEKLDNKLYIQELIIIVKFLNDMIIIKGTWYSSTGNVEIEQTYLDKNMINAIKNN